MEREQVENNTSARVWDMLLKAMVPLSVVIGGALIGHEVRLSRIEDTRFTKENGLQLERSFRQWVEQRFPPEWLLSDIADIKEELRELKVILKEK